jgi:hypothetical protein
MRDLNPTEVLPSPATLERWITELAGIGIKAAAVN